MTLVKLLLVLTGVVSAQADQIWRPDFLSASTQFYGPSSPTGPVIVRPTSTAASVTTGTQSTPGGSSTITTKDGTKIFYKDWGTGQPIVFSHGAPLSADDWDAQMFFFGSHGFRVIAHDRRGHGRSSQPWDGHNMDQYSDDLSELIEYLNLTNAVLVAHSTGGGEITRYMGRHGTSRIAKAVLISSVPPHLIANIPKPVWDGFRAGILADRSTIYRSMTIPFYGYNRPNVTSSQGVIDHFVIQCQQGSIKAHYDTMTALSETDFTDDLKSIKIPLLVMHGLDDQIVPFPFARQLSHQLVKGSQLVTYPGFPHGMCTTHADVINADLLAFI
ncbi:Non-heme chloroperoxidase [Hypsibius exemplaris]|uniref:Non-heme chloroperoxidase n=1 Tax=Hypsibius exemplaris TaxID=2072580 RepID=A0A9X6NHG9_HYPEX|nr:Non-heme chloroperoxidase [Hypsibius exemplaris]